MRYEWLALLVGYGLDLLFGDPHWLVHPVRWIGSLIGYLDRNLRGSRRKEGEGPVKRELMSGISLVVLVTGITTGSAVLLLFLAGKVHPAVGFVLESIMCYQLLATKSLKDESMKVYRELKKGDIEGARKAVSMIVGRDTARLDGEGIAKAAVETVAENTSDGIIAPMLYMALFGAAGGFFYKAINTMDSMVGYKNDKYLYFGRAAAKLDDIVNFVPARISAFLMIAACIPLKLSAKNAFRIFKRDRFNHASPNSAQTESVCAGALGVQLAGDAWYFGELHKKKTIGDGQRNVTYEDIKTANRLLYVTAAFGILLAAAVRMLICLLV